MVTLNQLAPSNINADDRFAVVSNRFEVEKINRAIRIKTELLRDEWGVDDLVFRLITSIVALPERGTLVIYRPSTWWDYVKEGLRMRWDLFRRLRVNKTAENYEAHRYFPLIEIPEKLSRGSFCAWWVKP